MAASSCPENPLAMVYQCKVSDVCSHMFVMNYWLGEIDLHHLMADIGIGNRAEGGFRKGVRPGLLKETQKTRMLN